VEMGDKRPGKFPRIETRHATKIFTFTIDLGDGQAPIDLVVTCHDAGSMVVALRNTKDPTC
jgi:hypothetical protein